VDKNKNESANLRDDDENQSIPTDAAPSHRKIDKINSKSPTANISSINNKFSDRAS
jgi:hypothetical protein